MRILIIDDEQNTSSFIRKELKPYYAVDVTSTGKSGAHLAEVTNYDLIILDLGLPDIDGIEVCKIIRRNKIKTPILMLTARDAIASRVEGLDSGGDDYLTKPFSFDELNARIRVLLRRESLTSESVILSYENIVMDIKKRIVKRGNTPIYLRRKEFDLLEYLLRNKGKVVTREMILEHVWQDDTNLFSNAVDVHIKYLRDKVDEPFSTALILTVHGVGYRLGLNS